MVSLDLRRLDRVLEVDPTSLAARIQAGATGPGLEEQQAVSVAIESLYDAADDDSATGGPDLGRQIWPTVAVVDHSGARFVASDVLEGHVQRVVAARRDNPGGAR